LPPHVHHRVKLDLQNKYAICTKARGIRAARASSHCATTVRRPRRYFEVRGWSGARRLAIGLIPVESRRMERGRCKKEDKICTYVEFAIS